MRACHHEPRHIGDVLRERNIELATNDPVARLGFTQVPNFILKDAKLSLGAKVTYSMFLHYAWHNDSCFPGQDRLAADMGIEPIGRVSEFIKELQEAGSSRSRAAVRARPTSTRSSLWCSKATKTGEASDILISTGRYQDISRVEIQKSAGSYHSSY